MALKEGEQIGKFVIKGVLGQGGFGTVYLAEDTVLGETVALKARAVLGDAQNLVRQLVAEFKAADAITDRKHVLKTYPPDKATHRNLEWVLLPMERAEYSLRDWLEKTRGDLEGRLEKGLEMFRQACRGVQALHDQGLVHLDIKPANILIVKEGKHHIVKVADFGLARGMAESRAELSADGIGTPAYMAPEQVLAARWKDVKEPADVYGLGMILYELLDGDLPYSGTAEQIKEKKRDREVQISRPAGPDHLADIAMACLDRDTSNRPVLTELERIRTTDPEEENAFKTAQKTDIEEAWEEFLGFYPKGRHAAEVKTRLSMLCSARAAREQAEAEQSAREQADREAQKADEAEQRAKEMARAEKRRREEESRIKVEEERRRREGIPPLNPEPLDSWICTKNGTFVRFVFIPPGQFNMGPGPSDDTSLGGGKLSQHSVRVSRGFWLSSELITVGEYKIFCDATGRLVPERDTYFNPDRGNRDPIQVCWHDAVAFCEWAGGRLPCEAEWEYAARAETGWAFWWGSELDPSMVWPREHRSRPVGEKPPNPWGLFDVLGNVWEWCADEWHDDYNGAPDVAIAWPHGDPRLRVIRGGWQYINHDLLGVWRRTADLIQNEGSRAQGTAGIRCVVDVAKT